MERKINKLEHCVTEVLVTFSTDKWKAAQKKAFNKLAKQVKINGFKDPTKAPEKMIRDHMDPAKLMNESINVLLPTAYTAIVNEDHIEPFAQPVIDVTEVTDDKLVVKFTITTAPSVKLGTYKGLKVGKTNPEVTDAEVDAEVAKVQDEFATLVVKDGEAKDGDTVVIDFVGKTDGTPFEGGTAENYELVLGSHSFIPGFEDQCVGHKSGDKFTINVKFPENYVDNLKGKDATFDITLHEVKEKKLPALDENLIKEANIPGVDSVEKLKETKKAQLLATKTQNLRKSYMDKLLDEIAKGSEIEIADAVIADEKQARTKKISDNLAQQGGFTIEQYLQVLGKTREEFDKEIETESTKAIRDQAIIEAVLATEKITLTDEQFEFELAKLADNYKMKVEDVKKAIAGREGQFRVQILFGKAEDLLFENNN